MSLVGFLPLFTLGFWSKTHGFEPCWRWRTSGGNLFIMAVHLPWASGWFRFWFVLSLLFWFFFHQTSQPTCACASVCVTSQVCGEKLQQFGWFPSSTFQGNLKVFGILTMILLAEFLHHLGCKQNNLTNMFQMAINSETDSLSYSDAFSGLWRGE